MTPTKSMDDPAHHGIHEYADGRATERAGTEMPGFLKLSFPLIAAGAVAYFFIYMYGAVNHPDRGPQMKAMNAATEASGALMYVVAAMIIVFGVIVMAFSFRRSK